MLAYFQLLCVIIKRPKNPTSKDILFDGLSAVIALLCEFDNIKNVMDFSKLFEQENGFPTYHLETFLA